MSTVSALQIQNQPKPAGYSLPIEARELGEIDSVSGDSTQDVATGHAKMRVRILTMKEGGRIDKDTEWEGERERPREERKKPFFF